MKKTSQPIVYLLIWASISITISLACNFPMGNRQRLSLDPPAEDGSISGGYRYSNAGSVQLVDFTVTTDGFATFHIEDSPYSETVSVLLSDEKNANITWAGYTFDGLGSLTEDELVALDNLMNSDLGQSMAMIPLDVACQGDESIDPRQLAALLVPLQMHFKYLVSERGAEAERLMALSACEYGNETKKVHHILFAPSMPVPVVFGYFPFDEQGAVEPTLSDTPKTEMACLDSSPSMISIGLSPFSPLGENEGPCNAMCRGACGADCNLRNCALRKEVRCEKDETGKNTGMEASFQIYDCGVHQGCIDHDACYDACNAKWGCGTWYAAFCMHADAGVIDSNPQSSASGPESCDAKAIKEHGFLNAQAWAMGGGNQPRRETFEYIETWTKQYNPNKCSPEILYPTSEIVIVTPTNTPPAIETVEVDPSDNELVFPLHYKGEGVSTDSILNHNIDGDTVCPSTATWEITLSENGQLHGSYLNTNPQIAHGGQCSDSTHGEHRIDFSGIHSDGHFEITKSNLYYDYTNYQFRGHDKNIEGHYDAQRIYTDPTYRYESNTFANWTDVFEHEFNLPQVNGP